MNIFLEPLASKHLADVSVLWQDPVVIRYTNVPEPLSPIQSAARLEKLLSCQTALAEPVMWAVMADCGFCGIVGCPPVNAERGVFGLFYQLFPGVWGEGVGTEAARLALSLLERQAPGATVLADVVEENTASIRILERLCFARSSIQIGAFSRGNQTLDIWNYTHRLGGAEEETI